MSENNRIVLNINHPNSRNAEAFLNSWDEPFVPENGGTDRYVFHSAISLARVEIVFFDAQREAFDYGIKHFDPVAGKRRWGVNGGFLYSVTADDEDIVSSLAGHFAGRE